MQDLPLPIEFRSEVLGPLFKTLASGESCSLVGVGSSGKSNIVRHLAQVDVREHYLGKSARNTLCLHVDCVELSDYTIRALQMLMLDALLHAVERADTNLAAFGRDLSLVWDQATGSDSPERVRRALEEAIASVLQAGIAQLFIILDDFDHVVQKAPAPVLNSLRAVRDKHKYQVMYVTVTRRELAFLRDPSEYEDFYEIVCCSQAIPVGPYRDPDADFMIERLARRWDLSNALSVEERRRLRQVSGCHAGLLRAILWSTQKSEPISLLSPDLVEKLRGHKDIEPECVKILEALEDDEKMTLAGLVKPDWPQGAAIEQLVAKGLICKRLDGTWRIFSPVLASFVRDQLPRDRFDVQVDPDLMVVRVDGQAVQDLDAVEYQLFAFLYDKRGQSVALAELIDRMVKAESGPHRFHGPPDQRLASYLAELIRRVNSGGLEYVVFEPEGYRLVSPDGR